MSDNIGQQVSFGQLIAKFGRVQIPIIQRDYAQGRKACEDVRGAFLAALHQGLISTENAPLNLDFVYGSGLATDQKDAQGNAGNGFAPLDGQQRLTTLFLLHWYLALRDGKAVEFQQHFVVPVTARSRFTYEVRPSSIDFFDALVNNFPAEPPPPGISLRALLEDSTWFFRSWRRDPTIDATLNTLDDLHERFYDCPPDSYNQLTLASQPRITFQLLPLEGFGLSDDLYVKMNARGKPLTSFESLKAQLLKRMLQMSLSRAWDLDRFDGVWLDLFWNHTKRPSPGLKWEMDDAMMRVIKTVALTALDPEAPNVTSSAYALKNESAEQLTLQKLDDIDSMTPNLAETLFSLLDNWASLDGEQWTGIGREQFEATIASREPGYPDLVIFAAFARFCRKHSITSDTVALHEWMRVIKNLTRNSEIKSSTEFIGALKAVSLLEPHISGVLDHLPTAADLPVFNKQQQREERIKAWLVNRDDEWRALVIEAEQHGYFQGQIEFLLSFSGLLERWKDGRCTWPTDDDEVQDRNSFRRYLGQATSVFYPNGLRSFPDFKWERALLSKGDYTLGWGSYNASLLQDGAGENERPTWKVLLRGANRPVEQRRSLVKALFDSLPTDLAIEDALDAILASAFVDQPWRAMLIEHPELIDYCRNKMIRHRNDGSVYLISKLRTSSSHRELWSYHLYITRLRDHDTCPWTTSYVSSDTEEVVPYIVLTWAEQGIRVEVDFHHHHFRFALRQNEKPVQVKLIASLEPLFGVTSSDSWVYATIAPEKIGEGLHLILDLARLTE